MRRVGMLAVLLVGLLGSGASQAALIQDGQSWTVLTLTGRLFQSAPAIGQAPAEPPSPSPWLIYGEFQPRISFTQATELAIFRSAIGYDLSPYLPGLSLWQGVAWIPTWTSKDGDTGLNLNEGRLFQQALYTLKGLPVALTFRGRLEERLLGVAPHEMSLRGRLMVKAGYAIPGTDDRLSIVASDEAFAHIVSSSDKGPKPGFDQNRAFLGLQWRPLGSLAFEAGYMANNVNLGTDWRFNHIVQTSLAVSWL